MNTTSSEPAVTPAILLSDTVIREAGTGKLTLVGVFSVLNSTRFPYQAAPFSVTAFITNFSAGTEKANIVIRVEEANSGLVFASAAAIVQFEPGKIVPSAMVEIPFILSGVVFPHPCLCRVVVLTNDEKLAERTFSVNLVSPPPQLQPPA